VLELLLALIVFGALLLWAALATCTIETFTPQAEYRSQLSGPSAHDRLVAALLSLPGVREVERSGTYVLLSVLPVPSSMDRGYGLFVLAGPTDDGATLLARSRLPLPGPNVSAALRQLEREARQRCTPRPA
jgi:hypothetical protein